MNFKFINPHSVKWLIPLWAVDPFQLAVGLDNMLADAPPMISRTWNVKKTYYIDVHIIGRDANIRISSPDKSNPLCGNLIIRSNTFNIKIPINLMLKGALPLRDMNSLYYHSFQCECPLGYFGLTKQRWFDRLAQHKSSAARGSPYLFHRAIREHSDKVMNHTVACAGMGRDEVMRWEEEYVGRMTLYPMGLNMIPGGYAGLKYLHTLGFSNASSENRDELLEDAITRTSVMGRPNPLCIARWENDQDFVNRIICGHSGRLTLDQVRVIRLMNLAGHSTDKIAEHVGSASKRINRVLGGRVYGRVA